MMRKHVECWRWYATKDRKEFLRMADDYRDPGTKQRYYMIQEYRSGQIREHGLNHAQAYKFMLNECIIPGIEQVEV